MPPALAREPEPGRTPIGGTLDRRATNVVLHVEARSDVRRLPGWRQSAAVHVRIANPPELSREEAAGFARGVQSRAGRVVFTNGVFDLLHPGHVRYLARARALGDALIVGVNSDRSVRRIKGPDRPINRAQERVELLLALAVVDVAVVFDEDTPQALIAALQPDVLVKGADWAADRIVGREVVEARGGRVVRLDLAEGFSTTGLLGKTLLRGHS